MANIEKLKPFILKWEGGFVDDPVDKGGATNKGITIATFRRFYGANATVASLKELTETQWLHIFRVGYWEPCGADSLVSQPVANMLVDWAWASGTQTAIRQVQRLLGITVDGIAGVQTVNAINAMEERTMFEALKSRRLAFIDAIVKRDATQVRFLKGWKNRILDI